MNADRPPRQAVQIGPDSTQMLEQVVSLVEYKEGWSFEFLVRDRVSEHLSGGFGPTLVIRAKVQNSLKDEPTQVAHLFAPPPANWDRPTWRRWVFDCICQVELHEAMEFFAWNGEKIFFPAHGIGKNPYEVRERGVG